MRVRGIDFPHDVPAAWDGSPEATYNPAGAVESNFGRRGFFEVAADWAIVSVIGVACWLIAVLSFA